MKLDGNSLNCVAETARPAVAMLARLTDEVLGGELNALTIIGEAVGAVFDRQRDSIHSVVVVGRIDMQGLRRLAAHGKELGRAAIAAPLIMTPPYIKSSLDSFPLELIEIHQRRATVYGEDYFDDVAFNSTHVRLQCERELKRVLIVMRQELLASEGRERLVAPIEHEISAILIRTLRGMLWIKNERQYASRTMLVDRIEGMLNQKLAGLRAAMEEGDLLGWEHFDKLYHDVESLGAAVDAW